MCGIGDRPGTADCLAVEAVSSNRSSAQDSLIAGQLQGYRT